MANILTIPTALGPDDLDDGEQGRRLRRLAIATLDQSQVRLDKLSYKVPSQSGNGVYLANLELGPYCTCPDFEKQAGLRRRGDPAARRPAGPSPSG